MSFNTLISTSELHEHLADAKWAVVDCRYSLDDKRRGWRDYLLSHIPGAVYAHLSDDLASPAVAGKTGRHPLPTIDSLTATLEKWGIGSDTQVVAYDDGNGAIAARLWWLLKWLGHDQVAVLDGGWEAWRRDQLPTTLGRETRHAATFSPQPCPHLAVNVEAVTSRRNDPAWRVVDSRTRDRYRGEFEPIDPVAGRIPGAINIPHPGNIGPDGKFLSPSELRSQFKSILGSTPADQTIFYCGSGVTAAHNILAYAHAGLGEARLFSGSWSEWIVDPLRPVATGR